MQFYMDSTREQETHALTDAETFYVGHGYGASQVGDGKPLLLRLGWYWWSCFPGCLPDGDPIGPFNTEALAIADAQESGVA